MPNLILKIKNKIKNWRQGEYTPYKGIKNSTTIVLGASHYKRSFLANVVHGVVTFCKKYPQYAIPLGILFIGFIGLIIAFINLLLNIFH